jgi:hypothetical protein
MEKTFIVPLITAGAGLTGATLGALITYFLNKRKDKRALLRDIWEAIVEYYMGVKTHLDDYKELLPKGDKLKKSRSRTGSFRT